MDANFFGPIRYKAAELLDHLLSTESQTDRVTESQTDRITESQSEDISTSYMGG